MKFDTNFAFYRGESKRLSIRVNVKSSGCNDPLGIDPVLAPATLLVQDISFVAKSPFGNTGNNFKVEFVAGGIAGSEVVTITNLPNKGKKISVKIDDGISTALQILNKIIAHSQYGVFFTALTANPANTQVAEALTSFSGGTGDMVEVLLPAEPANLLLSQATTPQVVVDDGPLSKISVELTDIETNQMISGPIIVTVTKFGKSSVHVVHGGASKLAAEAC